MISRKYRFAPIAEAVTREMADDQISVPTFKEISSFSGNLMKMSLIFDTSCQS